MGFCLYLQSYVVPVCLFIDEDGVANLRKLIGTAFFIGRGGFYLTARHVLEQAFSEAERDGREVCLVVKNEHGRSDENRVLKIDKYEFAPEPYDVAVGWVGYHPEPPLKVQPFHASVWQDVGALGYPEAASVMEGEALWMNVRGYRGYVQRPTIPRDMKLGNHPNGYELSFLLGPGSSGGPVFTVPDEILIGIGVGSYKSEHVEDEFTEVDDDGREYRERRVRIEQFGFAHEIAGLLDWRPDVFGGGSLQEIAAL